MTIVRLDLRQRIARGVAIRTIASLNWNESPEFADAAIDIPERKPWVYTVAFPLWGMPNKINRVEVQIHPDKKHHRWSHGELSAYGWWQHEGDAPWRQQRFEIQWSELCAPSIMYGTCEDTAPSTSHPFTAEEIREIEVSKISEAPNYPALETLNHHTRFCPDCAWTLAKYAYDRRHANG